MSEEPLLSKFAASLDPLDREGVRQFRRLVEYLTVKLDDERRAELIERLTTAIAMLELAGITGEAAFRFRSELVSAAKAIDHAVGDRKSPNTRYFETG